MPAVAKRRSRKQADEGFASESEQSIVGWMGRRLRRQLEQMAGSLRGSSDKARSALQKYCPHRPWPKQKMFCDLDCTEAFYGGAAGGGKSDTLLMSALQYVDVPGYAALILRRDTQRLALAGSIMDRAKAWLYNTDASWNEQRKMFRFPTGAVLQFGYVDHPDDRFRYASSEYQFIGWDELTEFRLTDDESNPYTFLFSRLRKTTDIDVPLRMRSASNPGNIGHYWVKSRFVSEEASTAILRGEDGIFDGPEGRKFVPAAIADNPAVDAEQYRKSLAHLPPITRERLMHGDWSVTEELIIPPHWLRYFETRGEIIAPEGVASVFDSRNCLRFATIDTAGTSRDKAEETRGKPRSWSVLAVWDYYQPLDLLCLRHVWRDRVGWGELKSRISGVLTEWRVPTAYAENAHWGPALQEELRQHRIEMTGPVLPGMSDGYRGAKLERAIASGLITRLEAGKLLLPQTGTMGVHWREEYIRELTTWNGMPDSTADQIDVSSYAAHACRRDGQSWGGVLSR